MKILRFFLTVCVMMVSMFSWGYDFEVNGIYYGIDGKNAYVTYNTDTIGHYSGDVTIPRYVTYDGAIYMVRSIGDSAFFSCPVTSVTIPNGVESIGRDAFHNCKSLTSVQIPNSVTSIGTNAFCSCQNLTSNIFLGNVTHLGDGAFSECIGLKYVYFGDRVDSIKSYSFYACTGLTAFIIPHSVKYIDDYAFFGCEKLDRILCPISYPLSVDSSVFDHVDKSKCVLYVPIGSAEEYKSAAVWSEFKNICEFDMSFDDNPLLDDRITMWHIFFHVNSDFTAIGNVSLDDNASDKNYNLRGEKVNDNYRGIVIKNGKKVVK